MVRFWFALILLFCNPVFAQTLPSGSGDFVARNQVYEIKKFEKLQYSNQNPHTIPADGAILAQNVRTNTNIGSLNKRPAMITYGTVNASNPVKTVFKYYKSDGSKNTIVSVDTSIYSGNDTSGAFTQIKSGLTTGKRFTCVTYKDNAICSNGIDVPQKWDGSCSTVSGVAGARSAGECMTSLGAPYASQAAGATGLTGGKWYQYHVAYYDGTNYQFSSNKSNPIQVDTSIYGVTLSDIPLGPTGTTSRILYRTAGKDTKAAVEAETTYYKVNTSTTLDNNSTQSYTDTETDATMIAADLTPKWVTVSAGINATPPKGKFLMIDNERLWMANDASIAQGKSTVYFSSTYIPDYVLSSQNYFLIRPDDGDEITFLKVYLGMITVGKTNTISTINAEDTTTTNWTVSKPKSFVGCAAPYSAMSTPYGIFYLGRDGLYAFKGDSSEMIADRVLDVIRDMNQVNIGEVAGIYFNNEYHLAYTSTSTGSSINDRVLVFDAVNDSFQIDTKNIDSFAVANAGTDYGSLIMGTSASTGKVLIAQQNPATLVYNKLSQIDEGTFTATDSWGTENNPWISLGWGKTWAQMTGTWAAQSGTWGVSALTGYWYSPIVQVNAASFSKLYWNEVLGSTGTVSFAIRAGATTGAVSAASWSSEFTNSAGADVSSVTGNVYVQLRAKLVTTSYAYSPVIQLADNYNIKLVYNQIGTIGESSYTTDWESGFYGFNDAYSNYPKRIRSIDFNYTGTAGTLTVGLKNSEGTIDTSFDIDLSEVGDGSSTNPYGKDGVYKTYHWEPPANSITTPSPVGNYWRFSFKETGTTAWNIQRVAVIFDVMPRRTP